MASLSSNLEHKAIGEAQSRASPEVPEGCGNGVAVLDRQIFVAEKHFDRRRYLAGTQLKHGCEHPYSLDEHEMGHPRPGSDEAFCRVDLLRMIPRREPHQHIGVNRAHGDP